MISTPRYLLELRLRLALWLNTPLATGKCVLGWLTATALFYVLVTAAGGPSVNDSSQSVESALAVAHAHWSCAFPPHLGTTAPGYIFFSGGIAALLHAGHSSPFPTHLALGHNCDGAFISIYQWSIRTSAFTEALRIGFLSWLPLMAGLILWLRASGRGRCGWEPTSLVIAACLPSVWICLQSTFHPEDLAAMGLALCSVACARRERWTAAGIAVGLAFLFQQFAVLVAVPLLIAAPPHQRLRYFVGALATVSAATIPLVLLLSNHLFHEVVIGTGYTKVDGGTWVWATGLNGAPLAIVSRVLPIILSIVLSVAIVRRTELASIDSVVLVAMVTASLGLRLVFEFNLYTYYFMPLAVGLLLLEVTRGQFRYSTMVWLTGVSLLSVPVTFLRFSSSVGPGIDLLPILVLAAGCALVVVPLVRGQSVWMAAAVALATVVAVEWRIHGGTIRGPLPAWVLQIVFVSAGMVLALGPLLQRVRQSDELLSGN